MEQGFHVDKVVYLILVKKRYSLTASDHFDVDALFSGVPIANEAFGHLGQLLLIEPCRGTDVLLRETGGIKPLAVHRPGDARRKEEKRQDDNEKDVGSPFEDLY